MTRISALLLLAITTPGWASDNLSINFEVTADVAACTPTLSNNGTVDFGSRSVNSLAKTTFTQLGTRELTLTINCESSTAVAITSRDTRTSSVRAGEDAQGGVGPLFTDRYVANATGQFGLGFTAENKPIGSYAVQINAAGVTASDGEQNVSVDMAGAESKDGPWVISDYPTLRTTEDFYLTFVKKGTAVVQPVSSAVVPLRISAAVANGLNSSQKIILDGEAVISLVYL